MTPDELAHITATPAALGRSIGPKLMGRKYVIHPWLLHLEREIMAMLYRPGNEVMIVSVPPQEGKSSYCSMFLPLWYLGRNPGHQIINISYNADQAAKWGLRVRNAMRMFGPQLFNTTISPDSDSQYDWKMGNGFGGMMSAGIRGGITGNPGDFIVIDDVIKTAEEANSPLINKRNLDEFDSSVMTRLQENTKILIVATRWTPHDLSGNVHERSLAEDYAGIPVRVLNIKALAEPDPLERERMTEAELEAWRDLLGRRFGEGLKGQHSQRFFEMMRASRPIGVWNSLYQGTPVYATGGMFPEIHWAYWHDRGERVPGDADLPHIVQQVRVWDLASSEGAGDWTVGTLLGKSSENKVFILDRQRFRHGPGMVLEKVKATAAADGFEVTILIEEERAGSGKTTTEHYRQALVGHRVEVAKAEGSKESRATPYSILQNQSHVYLPRNAPWIREWIDEHNKMDGKGGMPPHDDQIDTAAYGVRFLVGSADSILWDWSQIGAGDNLTSDERAHMALVRQALGL